MIPGKYNIRSAGQISRMQAESEAGTVEERSDPSFGSRILAPDARHIPAALFGSETVSHHESPFRESRISTTISAIWAAR
jgi:hypothetical protein